MKIYSFGYKYGDLVEDFDFEVDLRNKLKNPVSHLPKGAIGLDRIVIDTVLGTDQNKKVFENLFVKVKRLIKSDGEDLTVAFGCHSGIHRSVVFAEELQKRLTKMKLDSSVHHIHLKPRSDV